MAHGGLIKTTETGIHNPCYEGDNISLGNETLQTDDNSSQSNISLRRQKLDPTQRHPLPNWFNWNKLFENDDEQNDENSERTENDLCHDDDSDDTSKPTRMLYMLTFLSAISSFVLGYDTGVASGVLIMVRKQFMLNTTLQELFIASTIGAAALGAIIGGIANEKCGRKPVILVASMTAVLGSLGLAVSRNTFNLILGRIIVGLGIGLSSTTVPIYIAEHAPTNIRGGLVNVSALFVTGGQFVATLIDGAFSQFENGWRLMLGLAAVTSAIQLVSFMFMPESPRWLIGQGKVDDAKQVLELVRGEDFDVNNEVKRIKESLSESTGLLGKALKGWPFLKKVLETTAVRRAIFIGAMLQIFQQLSGVNNIMYYDATIIKMSGVKDDREAIWLATIPAGVNFSFTFLAIILVDRLGRRALIISSLVGTLFSLVLLAFGFQLSSARAPDVAVFELGNASLCHEYTNCNPCVLDERCGFCYENYGHFGQSGSCLPAAKYGKLLDPTKSEYGRCKIINTSSIHALTWAYDYCPTDVSWVVFLALILYLAFFAPGMGPLPWTINAEIYPLWVRSFGNSISTTSNWITNLIVSMTFLTLSEKITRYGVFYLYAGFTLLALIFIYLFLPETTNKTLEEVEGLFEGPWRVRNKSQVSDQHINMCHPIPHSSASSHFPQNGWARPYGYTEERVVRLDDMHIRPPMDGTPGPNAASLYESET